MHKILENVGKIGIVPVIKIDDPEKAIPLAHALKAGGIPVAEVTFRTAQGEEAIHKISKEVPDIIIGAGTVLTTDQVDRAISAGAQFIVSPGFNPKIVSYAISKGIPILPGCCNPSDIERALEAGLEVVKFFPAEQAGGLDYIKAVSAPYTTLKFIPTGGISPANIAKYIAFDRIVACGGSWMVTSDLINTGNFDKITALCKEAVQTMLGFSFVHLGINTENPDNAKNAGNFFNTIFGLPCKDGTNSMFLTDQIEIMKKTGFGTKGHIAIGTNCVAKAVAYLERLGISFIPDSIKKDDSGNITFAYLKDEVAGFALHLFQKK